MKKTLAMLAFCTLAGCSGNSISGGGVIIADHTAVERADAIPQEYLDIIKTMLVDIAGESHGSGYRIGVGLLEQQDARFAVETFSGTPPAITTANLRLGQHGSVGEEDFFTNDAAIVTIKQVIANLHNAGNPLDVLGLGWCWDFTDTGTGVGEGGTNERDPVYNVRWYGRSAGGPDGSHFWGLDGGDAYLTGNEVCMDTYLSAVDEYNAYCKGNGYACTVIFTTGPVDGNAASENGFQRELKHDHIRAHVRSISGAVLFDYADILCWNNDGEHYVTNWNDGGTIRPHANIHPDNMMDYDASWNIISHTEDGDHIGEVGAVRLARAMWWMLARMAGWGG